MQCHKEYISCCLVKKSKFEIHVGYRNSPFSSARKIITMSAQDDGLDDAILNFINSLGLLDTKVADMTDLRDGAVLLQCLVLINKEHFEGCSISKGGSPVGNVKQLLGGMETYFKDSFGKKVPVHSIVPERLQGDGWRDELLKIAELVIGSAVMCENKAVFIRKIFSLDATSQAKLKVIVERFMKSLQDVDTYDDRSDSDSSQGDENNAVSNEELLRTQEMMRHLHEERDHQAKELEDLRGENLKIREERDELVETQKEREGEQQRMESMEIHKNQEVSNQVQSLETELEEMKRMADLKTLEYDTLSDKFQRSDLVLKQSKEAQLNLEMQLQQMNDELDVARDKSTKLIKAEATIAKYQRKVEELISLRKENKEQLDKLDEYSNKIHELENSKQSMTNLQKVVEQYKNKSVEFEREKFEAISALQIKQDELDRVQQELSEASNSKKLLNEELTAAREEIQHHFLTESTLSEIESEEEKHESKASLREKINVLERELLSMKTAAKDSGARDSPSSSEIQQLALLQADFDRLQLEKSGRDDMLMAANKQLAETQGALQRSTHSLNELEAQASKTSEVKEAVQKLAQATITMKLLEERLKEKETTIFDLEQKKSQLESFSKTALQSFKNKFMSTLHTVQAEKEALEGALERLAERSELDRDTARREERLLLSSVYQIGVKIMDKNIAKASSADAEKYGP